MYHRHAGGLLSIQFQIQQHSNLKQDIFLIYSFSSPYSKLLVPTIKASTYNPPTSNQPIHPDQTLQPRQIPPNPLLMQHTLLPPPSPQRLAIRTLPVRPPLTPITQMPLGHAPRARCVRDVEGDVFPRLHRMLRVSAGIVWELLRCGGVLGWRTRD